MKVKHKRKRRVQKACQVLTREESRWQLQVFVSVAITELEIDITDVMNVIRLTRTRAKFIVIAGPFIVYLLKESDIIEDWTFIKKVKCDAPHDMCLLFAIPSVDGCCVCVYCEMYRRYDRQRNLMYANGRIVSSRVSIILVSPDFYLKPVPSTAVVSHVIALFFSRQKYTAVSVQCSFRGRPPAL